MKSAFEIWNDVPDQDKNSEAHKKVWIHRDELKDAIDKLNNTDAESEDYKTIYTEDLLKELRLD